MFRRVLEVVLVLVSFLPSMSQGAPPKKVLPSLVRIGDVVITVLPVIPEIDRESSLIVYDYEARPSLDPSIRRRFKWAMKADPESQPPTFELEAKTVYATLQRAADWLHVRTLVVQIPTEQIDLWLETYDLPTGFLAAVDQFAREGGGSIRQVVIVADRATSIIARRFDDLLRSGFYASADVRERAGFHLEAGVDTRLSNLPEESDARAFDRLSADPWATRAVTRSGDQIRSAKDRQKYRDFLRRFPPEIREQVIEIHRAMRASEAHSEAATRGR